MPFERPASSGEIRHELPLRARPGLKALAWMGALFTVAGSAGLAEAGPRADQEKKEAAPFKYEGTMRELGRRDDLDVEKEWRKVLPDGKVVSVYEGVDLLSADDVAEERVLDVHVMDDPDPKIGGDERWTECQVIVRTYEDRSRAKDFGYVCLDSAADARASGLHMDSPVGAFEAYDSRDPEWQQLGASPKTPDDWTIYELNNLYWAMKGLKEAGAGQSDAAQYLAKEFRGKVAEAQSHENTKPIDEGVLKEFLP